jgi:hypothetical protein
VHGIITTWRLRPDDGLDQLIHELNELLDAEGAELPGHVAGYAVLVGPAQLMMLNIYEDDEQAEIAARALALAALAVMADHGEEVERLMGPAFEITASIRAGPIEHLAG